MIETKKERIVRFLDRKLPEEIIAKLVPCSVRYVQTVKYAVRNPEWGIRAIRKSAQHG